jgi:hypothetical protein
MKNSKNNKMISVIKSLHLTLKIMKEMQCLELARLSYMEIKSIYVEYHYKSCSIIFCPYILDNVIALKYKIIIL